MMSRTRFSKSTPRSIVPRTSSLEPKNTLEELELQVKQLMDTLLGVVPEIEHVDDGHVDLLPIAVTATNALLDALWIPRKIEIDD